MIAGLNRIIEITIPKDWQEGGTMVIPGHGRICDEADVVEYRDMVTIIRDRIQEHDQEGHDARSSEGGAADARVRLALRIGQRPMDHFDVHRSRVSQFVAEMSMRIAATALLALLMCAPATPQARPAPALPKTPKQAAPIDLTGTWVSVVTEDWRWRMLIPAKGDYTSVPAQLRGTQSRRYVGSVQAGYRRMQALRRGGDHARAGAAADYLGERHHAANRYRCRATDAAALLR